MADCTVRRCPRCGVTRLAGDFRVGRRGPVAPCRDCRRRDDRRRQSGGKKAPPPVRWVEMCVLRVERPGAPGPLYSWRALGSDGFGAEFGCEPAVPDLLRWAYEVELFLSAWGL